jgi:hypothetical protein
MACKHRADTYLLHLLQQSIIRPICIACSLQVQNHIQNTMQYHAACKKASAARMKLALGRIPCVKHLRKFSKVQRVLLTGREVLKRKQVSAITQRQIAEVWSAQCREVDVLRKGVRHAAEAQREWML